jgi:predicted outer membrane protein
MVAGTLAIVAAVAIGQERRDPTTPAPPAREPAAGQRDPFGAGAQRDPATARAPGRAAPAGQFSRADQEIAAIKLAMCNNEVELAKLAQQKATSEDVRQFAERMIKDHTAACEKLEQVAGPLAAAHHGERAAPGERPAPGERRDPAARQVRPAAPAAPPAGAAGAGAQPTTPAAPGSRPGVDVTVRPGPAGGASAAGSLNWVSIHKEIADQCLASAKKEFAKKEGEDFDKCYIAGAIGSHQHAIDADHVFMNHASPAFRGDIEEGLKMATTHLNLAKDIMKKLEGQPPRLTARPDAPRTGTEPPRRNPDEALPNPNPPPRRPQ